MRQLRAILCSRSPATPDGSAGPSPVKKAPGSVSGRQESHPVPSGSTRGPASPKLTQLGAEPHGAVFGGTHECPRDIPMPESFRGFVQYGPVRGLALAKRSWTPRCVSGGSPSPELGPEALHGRTCRRWDQGSFRSLHFSRCHGCLHVAACTPTLEARIGPQHRRGRRRLMFSGTPASSGQSSVGVGACRHFGKCPANDQALASKMTAL